MFHLTIYQNSVQECLYNLSNDDQYCYHNSSCLTWSVKLYSEHSDVEPEPLKQKISKISKFQKGRGWSVRIQSVSLGQLIGVCARERRSRDKNKAVTGQVSRAHGWIKWEDKTREDEREKRARFGKCYKHPKKEENNLFWALQSEAEWWAGKKKMKGTTYQKEW